MKETRYAELLRSKDMWETQLRRLITDFESRKDALQVRIYNLEKRSRN